MWLICSQVNWNDRWGYDDGVQWYPPNGAGARQIVGLINALNTNFEVLQYINYYWFKLNAPCGASNSDINPSGESFYTALQWYDMCVGYQ